MSGIKSRSSTQEHGELISRTEVFNWRGQQVETTRFGSNGPVLIKPTVFKDKRGEFMESFNIELFDILGLPIFFSQSNVSRSNANVMRGMHVQSNHPQGKLIQCLSGCIQDIAANPVTKKYISVVLGSEQNELFFIPEGWAHGFQCFEPSTVMYQCTTLYDKDSDGGFNPLTAGLPWLEKTGIKMVISDKDLALPSLVDYGKQHS
jgi:dTDP-4-dehydrorhamnose 3,5-epimerase